MRSKGSCRFEKYYKREEWNPKALSWSPSQKTFPTKEEAERGAKGKFRILEVTEKGFKIL